MLRTMVTSRYLGTSTYVQSNSTVLRQVHNVALGCLASGRTGDSSTITNLRLLPFGRIRIGLLETSSLLGSGGVIAGFVVNVVGRESAAVLVAGASPPLTVAVLTITEKEDSAALLGTDEELAASSLTLHAQHAACKGIEGTTAAAAFTPFHLVFVGDLGPFLLLFLGPGCTFALRLGESSSSSGIVRRTKGFRV